MKRAGLGISTQVRDPAAAAREAVSAARDALDGASPDLALLAVTAAWGRAGAQAAVRAAGEEVDPEIVVGGSVDGVVAGGAEVLGNPAVAVLAVSGIEVEPFLHGELSSREQELGERVVTGLSRPPGPEDLVVLFLDSVALAPGAALASLEAALGPTALVGVGATASSMELPSVWHRTDIESAACAGLVLRGAKRPTLRVSHGFRPESGPHRVTRSQGLWVAELDGRPALDVYREAVPEPEPPAEWPREQVLVRRLAGIDEARGAISLPEAVEVGRQVGFVQRDSELARRDLEHQLSGLDGGAGAFGFYLTCATRGETLFGAPGAEAELVRQIVPEVPLLGILGAYQLFSPGELAPASLLTHSAVLALLPG